MDDLNDVELQETDPRVKGHLLDVLLDNIPDSIYFKDLESRFIEVSWSLVERFGLKKRAEAIGHIDFDFFTQEHAQQAYDDEQRIIRTGEPLIDFEERETWPDGSETWASTSKLPLLDEAGKVVGTFGVSRDITERKLVEAERTRLLRALEHRNAQLQAVAELSLMTSSILDPQALIEQVVDLIGVRFGLYYVGLFLVQETATLDALPGEWAYLQAGTGEAGQELKRQNQRLKVGGDSMVGQCIANGKAYRTSDLEARSVRFANPLLPATRSELALPLTSRGKTIGALTIQSTEEDAFSEEDVAIFQTMAGQLANAIENARLFEEAQSALERIENIQRRSVREGWSGYIKRGR